MEIVRNLQRGLGILPRDEAAYQVAMLVAERRYLVLHYFNGDIKEYRDNLYSLHYKFCYLLAARDRRWNQGPSLTHYNLNR